MSKYKNKIKNNKNKKNNIKNNIINKEKFKKTFEKKELDFNRKHLYQFECDYQEKLFWNVFRGFSGFTRNLILNQIKKGTKNRFGVYSYEEIKYSEWCIVNNYLELLKLKVSKGEPMIFSNSFNHNYYEYYEQSKCREPQKYYKRKNEIRKTYDYFYYNNFTLNSKYILYYVKPSIFNVFKQDGYEFFKSLFQNYSDYFKVQIKEACDSLFIRDDDASIVKQVELPSSYSRLHNQPLTFPEILNYIIVYDNVSALMVLVSMNHNMPLYYSNIHSNFMKAFDIGSLKVAEYLLKNVGGLNGKLDDETINRLWQSNIFSENGDNRVNVEKVKFMINLLNSVPQPSDIKLLNKLSYVLLNLFDFEIRNQNIYKVFKCCYYISKLYYNSGNDEIKSIIDNIMNKQFKEIKLLSSISKSQDFLHLNEFKILTTNELDEIKRKHEQQQQEIIGIFNYENNDIKSLFKMLLPFTDLKLGNFSFYKAKYYNQYFDEIIDKNVFDKSWFGIYDRNGIGKSPPTQELYFKYYQYDDDSRKEKNKEYIWSAISDMNDKKIDEMDKLNRDDIYRLIVYSDDLELFKYVFERFSKGIIGNFYSIIKSTEMFDYFYQETFSCRSMFETIITNYKLSNHFKTKYPQDYIDTILKTPSIGNLSNRVNKFSELEFIFENWSDFNSKTPKSTLMSLLKPLEFTNSQFSKLIQILKHSEKPNSENNGFENFMGNDYIYSTLSSLKLYMYILENHSSDLKNGKCLEPHHNIQITAAYFLNNLKEAVENCFIRNSFFFEEYVIMEIIKKTDLVSLDYIIEQLKTIKSSQSISHYPYNKRFDFIVKTAVGQGNIFVYKHLINKYHFNIDDTDIDLDSF